MNRMLADRRTAPLAGCVAALLATVIAAVALFPDQPAPRGALVLPALILTIGILVIPIARVMAGTDEVTNAENFVMVGFVFWLLLDLLQGAYDLRDASPESLRLALASIGVSAAAVWIGVAGKSWTPPAWLVTMTSRPLEPAIINRMVPVCFFLGMLNFAYSCDFDIPLMFSYLGGNRWSAPWARGQLGGWGSFIDQMPYFGYVLPSLTALLITRQGLMRLTSLIAVTCSLIMLLFLSQGGGRRLIGVTMGAALLVWLLTHPGFRVKTLLVIAVGGVAMAWASQFMLNIRTGGIDYFLESGSSYDYLHVDDNFLRLAQVIDMVPAEHPYVGTGQLVYTLVRPVPRVLWPDKPVDPGFDLAAEVKIKGVSLSTSIIGEWYLSYGWLAVIGGGWLHGRLAKAANGLRDHGVVARNPIVYALAVMVLVVGIRSMLDLVIMSYALVAWWGVNRLMSRRLALPA